MGMLMEPVLSLFFRLKEQTLQAINQSNSVELTLNEIRQVLMPCRCCCLRKALKPIPNLD